MREIKHLSKKNIGARKDQQDSVNITQNGDDILIALGDGMGGHTGGAKASNIFVTVAQNAFENKSYGNPKEFFEDIVFEAEEGIDKYEKQSGEDPHTTSTLALIKDGHVHFSNIGDSRVYIFDRDGLVVRSRDHSVPEMLLQMGEITEDEMATHPDQNKLTKSLGPDSHEKPSYYEHKLENSKDYIVLVCSDGFWEYVKEQEMMYFLFNSELEQALSNMIKIARERGGEKGDNISVGVVTMFYKEQKQTTCAKNEENVEQLNIESKKLSVKLPALLLVVLVLFVIAYKSFSEEPTVVNELKIKQKSVPMGDTNISKEDTVVKNEIKLNKDKIIQKEDKPFNDVIPDVNSSIKKVVHKKSLKAKVAITIYSSNEKNSSKPDSNNSKEKK